VQNSPIFYIFAVQFRDNQPVFKFLLFYKMTKKCSTYELESQVYKPKRFRLFWDEVVEEDSALEVYEKDDVCRWGFAWSGDIEDVLYHIDEAIRLINKIKNVTR